MNITLHLAFDYPFHHARAELFTFRRHNSWATALGPAEEKAPAGEAAPGDVSVLQRLRRYISFKSVAQKAVERFRFLFDPDVLPLPPRAENIADMFWGQVSVLFVVACFAAIALYMMRRTPHS